MINMHVVFLLFGLKYLCIGYISLDTYWSWEIGNMTNKN